VLHPEGAVVGRTIVSPDAEDGVGVGADVDVDTEVDVVIGADVLIRRAPQTRPLWVPLFKAFFSQQSLVVGSHETPTQVEAVLQRVMQESRLSSVRALLELMSEYMLSLKQAIWKLSPPAVKVVPSLDGQESELGVLDDAPMSKIVC